MNFDKAENAELVFGNDELVGDLDPNGPRSHNPFGHKQKEKGESLAQCQQVQA